MEKQFHVNKTVHEMLGLFPVELATCSKFLWPTNAHFINIKMLKLTIKTFV
jgi:hypothetical protein